MLCLITHADLRLVKIRLTGILYYLKKNGQQNQKCTGFLKPHTAKVRCPLLPKLFKFKRGESQYKK